MEILFFFALFLSLYSYLFFPPFALFMGKIMRQQWQTKPITPYVTVIISAYNEEKDIQEKITNTLQLEYPASKLEVIVSSDGSTDKTNEIVSAIEDDRLVLKASTGRLGKTACLNKVIPEAKGELILFTDANSMFEKNMLQQLVSNFSDAGIGAVSGWTKYKSVTGEETTGLYARLEKVTKEAESNTSSCVGADGAIFAIRKELYQPLGANDINDFIIPLNVVAQNKRVILDPLVFCIEEETKGLKNIFKRQIRITTRTAWAIRRNLKLINFFKYRSFSFFFLSHKILRLTVPFFIIITFIVNLLILGRSPIYLVTLAFQLLFFTLSLTALTGIIEGKIVSICKYFFITFTAHFIGCIRMIVGIEDIMWTPKR